MTWARPVGIGFLVVAVLFGLGVRAEVGDTPTSWLLVVVLAVLGLVCLGLGLALLVVPGRIERRRDTGHW